MDEELVSKLKEVLGELYPNYCIIVLDEEGEVQTEYTSVSVARMLLRESLLDFKDEDIDIIWDEGE
jgi:hypothetical protein